MKVWRKLLFQMYTKRTSTAILMWHKDSLKTKSNMRDKYSYEKVFSTEIYNCVQLIVMYNNIVITCNNISETFESKDKSTMIFLNSFLFKW